MLPYGSRESVRCILDKLSMTAEAGRLGVPVPETTATDEMVLDARGIAVLKPVAHVDVRTETWSRLTPPLCGGEPAPCVLRVSDRWSRTTSPAP